MKRYGLYLLLLNILTIPIYLQACSCCFFNEIFQVGSPEYNSLALIRIISTEDGQPGEQQIVKGIVLEDLYDNIPVDTIEILGDGVDCSPGIDGQVNDTIFLSCYEFSSPTYFGGDCGYFQLSFQNGDLSGWLTPSRRKISYQHFKDSLAYFRSLPNHFEIAGLVVSSTNENVKATNIDLALDGQIIGRIDTSGKYSFTYSVVISVGNRTENPFIPLYSDDDWLRGISIADIIKIRKHILGVEQFDSPWQYIAADVDNSKAISARDIIQLTKVLLGTANSFPNNHSWQFTTRHYSLAKNDPLNDNFLKSLIFELCEFGRPRNDLQAIKIGDVDGSSP